jgi:hypothetical protein
VTRDFDANQFFNPLAHLRPDFGALPVIPGPATRPADLLPAAIVSQLGDIGALDQEMADLLGRADRFSAYWGRLISQGVPPPIAQDMIQREHMAAINVMLHERVHHADD